MKTSARSKYPDIPPTFAAFKAQHPEMEVKNYFGHDPERSVYVCPVCYVTERALPRSSDAVAYSLSAFANESNRVVLHDVFSYDRHRKSAAHAARRKVYVLLNNGYSYASRSTASAVLHVHEYSRALGYLLWLDTLSPEDKARLRECESGFFDTDAPDFDAQLERVVSYNNPTRFVHGLEERGKALLKGEYMSVTIPRFYRSRPLRTRLLSRRLQHAAEDWINMCKGNTDPQKEGPMPKALFLYLRFAQKPAPVTHVAPAAEPVAESPPPAPVARKRAHKVFLKPSAQPLVFGRVRYS